MLWQDLLPSPSLYVVLGTVSPPASVSMGVSSSSVWLNIQSTALSTLLSYKESSSHMRNVFNMLKSLDLSFNLQQKFPAKWQVWCIVCWVKHWKWDTQKSMTCPAERVLACTHQNSHYMKTQNLASAYKSN